MTVTVKVTNTYEDGHTSQTVVDVDGPEDPTDLDEWWEDEVFPHTGDGHGDAHPKLGAGYEAEIIHADEPSLVGQRTEWY